jgi:hypothetical protein
LEARSRFLTSYYLTEYFSEHAPLDQRLNFLYEWTSTALHLKTKALPEVILNGQQLKSIKRMIDGSLWFDTQEFDKFDDNMKITTNNRETHVQWSLHAINNSDLPRDSLMYGKQGKEALVYWQYFGFMPSNHFTANPATGIDSVDRLNILKTNYYIIDTIKQDAYSFHKNNYDQYATSIFNNPFYCLVPLDKFITYWGAKDEFGRSFKREDIRDAQGNLIKIVVDTRLPKIEGWTYAISGYITAANLVQAGPIPIPVGISHENGVTFDYRGNFALFNSNSFGIKAPGTEAGINVLISNAYSIDTIGGVSYSLESPNASNFSKVIMPNPIDNSIAEAYCFNISVGGVLAPGSLMVNFTELQVGGNIHAIKDKINNILMFLDEKLPPELKQEIINQLYIQLAGMGQTLPGLP